MDLEFGPVELILAAYEGDTPDAGIIEAIASLAEAGTVRVIDLAHVSRGDDGSIEFFEVEEGQFAGLFGSGLDLAAGGLATEDDIVELAGQLAPGTSAVLLVVEFVWAKHLASRLAEANGVVVDSVRIPAPIVNEVVALARSAVVTEGES